MAFISCIISDTLKYAFLAEREITLRVFVLNIGIKANPAIAPTVPQAIMLLEVLRIMIALPFRFYETVMSSVKYFL